MKSIIYIMYHSRGFSPNSRGLGNPLSAMISSSP